MNKIFTKNNITIKELSERVGVSRPTMYKYLRNYRDNPGAVPPKVCELFDRMSSDDSLDSAGARDILDCFFPTEAQSFINKTDKELQPVIDGFCSDDQKQYNFMNLELPTGSRKSHGITNFIANYIKNGGKNNIVLITTLEKKLPPEEIRTEYNLRKSFEDSEIGSSYGDKVMIVNSLPNMLYKNYRNLGSLKKDYLRAKMGDEIADNLISHIQELDKAKIISKKAYDNSFERFRSFEADFRSHLVNLLRQQSKDPAKRKMIATSSDDWMWVSKLYPTVKTSDKQVFIMDIDEFLSTYDTIVEGSDPFYDSNIIDNALIFVDEFETTKSRVMQNMNKNGLNEIDYIGLFRLIYRTFGYYGGIPNEYYRVFQKMGDAGHTMEGQFKELIASTNSIATEYGLNWDFKMGDDIPEPHIFRKGCIVETGDNKEYLIEPDYEDRINHIVCIEKQPVMDNNNDKQPYSGLKSIRAMLEKVSELFRTFEEITFRMAMHYWDILTKEGETITKNDAIRTMLDPYDFNEDQLNYLIDAINYGVTLGNGKDASITDISIQSSDFEIFTFKNDNAHDLSTKICCKPTKRTPEELLLLVMGCLHNAKIVGISETAEPPLMLDGYDYLYLKNQKAFREYAISDDDKEHLRSLFQESKDQ